MTADVVPARADEWWRLARSRGALYLHLVETDPSPVAGVTGMTTTARVTYHADSPDGDELHEARYQTIDGARRVLTGRGARRVPTSPARGPMLGAPG